MSTEVREHPGAGAGPAIFQEVLQSLVHQRSHEETLGLICRRVSELAAFDFCGILLPDAEWEHVHLAASHAFPPRYLTRLRDVFLAPLRDLTLAGSPTETAIHQRRTAVMNDVLTDESFRPWRSLAAEGGYRSLVSVPLVVQGEVLGVLNGYSERPREFTAAQIATVETLAAQAALALRLTMLVDAQQETIAQLREANEQLRRHELMLERSHDIHLRLTAAVIAGADFHAVAQTLAELIGRPVLVTDAAGHPICTSDPPPDPPPSPGSAVVGRIRIGAELLGHVLVEEGDPASRDLDVRAVEHAGTVLALEIVKERVARATEERLRSDFLSDLLEGRDDVEERIVERARHHGLALGAEHRVVVAAVGGAAAAGRRRRAAALELVAAVAAEHLPGALVGQVADAVAAAVPAGAGQPGEPAALREALAASRARLAELAPGLSLTAGIGTAARAFGDFPGSHAGARRCIDVLRRLDRAGATMAADELGILGLFLDSTRPEELSAMAGQVLGPVLDRDARTGSALLRTLESYIEHGCDARAAARDLYVHVNTVKYRLRQAEELCGLSLRDPEDLLKVTIARLAVRLLGEPGSA
jgi:sugar diacid utilization regulator